MLPCVQYENGSLRASSGIHLLRGKEMMEIELMVTLYAVDLLCCEDIVLVLRTVRSFFFLCDPDI